jgi:hypothetical protein
VGRMGQHAALRNIATGLKITARRFPSAPRMPSMPLARIAHAVTAQVRGARAPQITHATMMGHVRLPRARQGQTSHPLLKLARVAAA